MKPFRAFLMPVSAGIAGSYGFVAWRAATMTDRELPGGRWLLVGLLIMGAAAFVWLCVELWRNEP